MATRKKVAAKEKKTTSKKPASTKASTKAASSSTKTDTRKLSNAKLETMLVDNRNDKGNWQVYADWLLENGESWGEVIVQVAKGKTPKKRIDEVTALLEDLGSDGATIKWKNGVIDHFTLTPEQTPKEAVGEEKMPRVLEAILRHPAGRLIRSLTLGLPPRVPGIITWNFDAIIAAIGRAGPLPLLEVIDMTPSADHMDQRSWRRIGDLRSLWKAAPRLLELHLQGSYGSDRDGPPIRFGTIEAPRLKKLIYISSGLDKAAPKEIGTSKLPSLEHLELYLGSEDYGNNCTVESFKDILDGKSLPKLKTLGIMNSRWEADLIEAIANAPITKRLENLDLSKGVLYNEGAEALLKHASKLRHLTIRLDENYIPIEYDGRLKKALPKIKLGDQREIEDGDYRFVAIGE